LKNLILFVLLCLATSFSTSIYAQHKVGVRAGTQYSKFRGPLELDETFSFGSGIHFGINYTYSLNDDFGIRAEILYAQRGSKQGMNTEDIYSIVRPIGTAEDIYTIGKVEYNIKYSNSYFSLPVTIQYELSKKWEIFAGASVDFLLGATGGFNNSGQNISILYDGEVTLIPAVVGAYYSYSPLTEVEGSRFKTVDFSLIGGVNYFINPGFYIGGRLEYGLLDLTNNDLDISLRETINEGASFILRDDIDKNMTLSFSFGFRF